MPKQGAGHSNQQSRSRGKPINEASARRWRYSELQKAAETFCGDVVTAHTASDRAEGVVMNLARGCDIQGLSALRNTRLLSDEAPDGPRLRRPFLHLTREETAEICTTLQLPIWLDPSNADLTMERNRIRHQVIPVLNDLHPGCEKRIAGLSERIAQLRDTQAGLSELAVQHLSRESGLDRQKMRHLDDPTCRAVACDMDQEGGNHQAPPAVNDSTSSAIGCEQGQVTANVTWETAGQFSGTVQRFDFKISTQSRKTDKPPLVKLPNRSAHR